MLESLKKELVHHADRRNAEALKRFFKTGPGEYAEGDEFLGIKVPLQRKIARAYQELPLRDTESLLRSKIHEERLVALIILIAKFKKADEGSRESMYKLYLRNTGFINNWDLVDLSAGHIVGVFLKDKPRGMLYKLAKSDSLWERRIAILSTFCYIMEGSCAETMKVAELLLHDRHDLIHKAVGWMLREAGKRCSQKAEEAFLKKHGAQMPRTMLRYAVERFPEGLRRKYMKMKQK